MAKIRILVAAGLVVSLLAPAAASADYLNFGSWSGYGTGNHHHHRYNGWNGNNNWRYDNGWRGYGVAPYGQARSCRAVKERAYDNWGNRVVIQRTQCYDRFGRAYIVPGSTIILRWH